jgi:hypothetical protein
MRTPNHESRITDHASLLTPQETEVLRLTALGLCRKQIAARMHLSVKTVEYYLNGSEHHGEAGIAKKLGTTNVALLTHYAILNGLVRLNFPPVATMEALGPTTRFTSGKPSAQPGVCRAAGGIPNHASRIPHHVSP